MPSRRYRALAQQAKIRNSDGVTNRLPQDLGEAVSCFPETHMGAQTIRVTLTDGRTFDNVTVAWGHEIIRVAGFEKLPFDAEDVVAVEDASSE